MNYDVKTIDAMLSEFDGNHSMLYRHIEDKVLKHVKESTLPDGFECFLYEFMFFEDDYLRIKRDMLTTGVSGPVYDIGAQMGYQSELFLDMGYVGIEKEKDLLFNEDHENVSYIKDVFPTPLADMTGKTVISNMSLSFFDHFVDEDLEKAREMILRELVNADVLYFRGAEEYVRELKKSFAFHKILHKDEFPQKENVVKPVWHQYKFWK